MSVRRARTGRVAAMSEQEMPGPAGAGDEQPLSAEQEQMLRQMEEEMRRLRVEDLLAQSAASILNLAYRRIAKEDERDLAQARVGIDAVRALADHLEPEAQREVKNAISQVQMIFAEQAGGDAGPAPGEAPEAGAEPDAGAAGGERKPPPGLWVPGSD